MRRPQIAPAQADGLICLSAQNSARRPAYAPLFAHVERSGAEVLTHPENRGKGAAVRTGFAASTGELVLFSDADLSTPLHEIEKLEAALEAGAGVAIASRALPDSNLEIRQAWYRERMGKTFNAIVRRVTGLPIRDTQCGFKLFRGEDARALATRMREDGFSFDVELLLLAKRRGLTVREVPVTWRNDAGSRVSPLEDALAMLLSLPRILRNVRRADA